MIKVKKVFFVILGIYFFVALSLAQAQGAPGVNVKSFKIHVNKHTQEIYAQLNLTEGQKKQLDTNKEQHRAMMEQDRRQMKIKKEALQEELMKPQLDMVKINEIHQEIKAVQAQIEDNKLSSILAVRSILTPEQFAKFISLIHKHRQEHGQ